nr:uncharacterized protein LOC129272629 [Lytechinus pictus]
MSSTRYSQPWINSNIKRLSRRKKRSYKKARMTKNNHDFLRYKQLQKECKQACKVAYSDYITNIVSPECSSNPKRFWSFINSKKCDNNGVSALFSPNNGMVSDSFTKASLLNKQFSSVFNGNEDITSIPQKGPSPYKSMEPIDVSPAGVYKLLHDLNPHKASGPDMIPARLLKELALELTPIFVHFYQASLNQGTIPEDWKKGNIVPVFKKGDRSLPENYRPVSLTSIVCKTLEHIVCSSIMKHLTCIIHYLMPNMASGKGDPVQRVVIDGATSEPATVLSGVPQGSVVGPLLFLLYINDLPEYVTNGSSVRLFADDCALYHPIRSREDAEDLQHDLDALQQWERDWGMTFHPGKCQVLHITRKKNFPHNRYFIHGQGLEEKGNAKYLGITFSNNLSWNAHVDSITKKANNTRCFSAKKSQAVQENTKVICYKMLLRPIMEYASEIWDPFTQSKSEIWK